jgi:hypothetical protein
MFAASHEIAGIGLTDKLHGRSYQLIRSIAWRLGFFGLRDQATLTAAWIAYRSNNSSKRKRILFVEDRVPHKYLGAGYPRSNLIAAGLSRMGLSVTLYPTIVSDERWWSVYSDLPLKVRVVRGEGLSGLVELLERENSSFDLVLISRPHNFAALRPYLDSHPRSLRKAKIVYDAEAIFVLRDLERRHQQGAPASLDDRRNLIAEEVRIGEGSHAIVSVSDNEARIFLEHGFNRVYTLRHAVDATPTPNPFESRNGVLFVGALHGEASPNADSIIWFVREVFPLMRQSLGSELKCFIAGFGTADFSDKLASDGVEVLGKVDDLTALYDQARMFVAPTRFAAGIPLKVCEAAAHGLPAVTTPLLARQLGWREGLELLTGDDAESFAAACIRLYRDGELWRQLRAKALERIQDEYSPGVFFATLEQLIEETLAAD